MKHKTKEARKSALLDEVLLDSIPEKGIIDIIVSYFA